MAMLRLVPASGPAVEIEKDKSIVGRDAGCDLVVNDVSVSRKHARFELWGGNWAVVDQRSANGTFLDGERITETKLRSGQELRFGAVAYRVEIEEENTGATVMMSMPTDATVLTPSGIPPRAPAAHAPAPPPRPAAPRPAAPPRSAPPPPPAPAPVSAPPPSPVLHMHPPAEPEKSGKGIAFWGALGCGGILLLGALGAGAVLGVPFLKSRGAVSAASAQIADIKNGDVDAAYARTSASYQAAHPSPAFAAFVQRHPGLRGNTEIDFSKRLVEDDQATLSGTLAHASGTENVVYRLVKERDEWRVSGIDVDGDEGAVAAAADDGMKVEIVAVNKQPAQGLTVVVKVDVRVTGFDLRPEGSAFRLNLVEDLETYGPDGRRIDELSRVGLQTFNQTTASATDAAATFNTTLTFSQPDRGRYRALITIRDMIGNKSKKQDVSFDLP
jgi:pSer/pThr/pTyr-binding forkhead associated (FHA) protein